MNSGDLLVATALAIIAVAAAGFAFIDIFIAWRERRRDER